ncbi:MAG: dipicolinate synthase subunit DpsA [Clostridia bacterium]|nr:dipicolinate synthase subunit DpsA [Clostridia bacterium]
MTKVIGIIGGDLRIIRLAEILAKDNYLIYTNALEKYNFLSDKIKYSSIQEMCIKCSYIVSGVPFSKHGEYVDTPFSNEKILIKGLFNNIKNKTLIAGGINKELEEDANKLNIKIIDLLKIEELTVLNVIPTVEGAIKVAIEETEFTINSSKCLILGFGRIGKLLAKSLKSLGAEVHCEARKEEDLAWIKAYGCEYIHLNNLDENLDSNYDIIFNTIPYVVLDKNRLQLLKRTKPLIIELASKPWGVDFEEANKLGIKVVKAPGLPGVVAPLTSAINIKNILDNIIK